MKNQFQEALIEPEDLSHWEQMHTPKVTDI